MLKSLTLPTIIAVGLANAGLANAATCGASFNDGKGEQSIQMSSNSDSLVTQFTGKSADQRFYYSAKVASDGEVTFSIQDDLKRNRIDTVGALSPHNYTQTTATLVDGAKAITLFIKCIK